LAHDPGTELRGTEAIKQFIESLRAAFPDLHHTVEDQIAEGDTVVVRYTGWGIPPTGKQIGSVRFQTALVR